MSIYIPEESEIYFSRTREYFQEVLSSYANKNYRSANVMLYSVAICDLLFKLQELSDMYNDYVANDILKEVEKCRNPHNNKSKSKWEKELIDNIFKRTELLDLEAYTNLLHLYDHRNFSAHPALNNNYELIAPTQETTIANIKNILNDILIKPPVFIKNIVDALTEELKEKKDIYIAEYKRLEIYLCSKYFSKLSASMKQKTFSALWKICFCLSDDENCMNNLAINRMALQILTQNNLAMFEKQIQSEKLKYTASTNDHCMLNLVVYFSCCPSLYESIDDSIKLQIDSFLEKNDPAKAISWFKSASHDEHIEYLTKQSNLSLPPRAIDHIVEEYKNVGLLSSLIDFFIEYYGCSPSFDEANFRFSKAIEPFLSNMNLKQILRLIKHTSENPQINERRSARTDNNKIVLECKEILGNDFNYTEYPNFMFDKVILEKKSKMNDEGFSAFSPFDDDALPF